MTGVARHGTFWFEEEKPMHIGLEAAAVYGFAESTPRSSFHLMLVLNVIHCFELDT